MSISFFFASSSNTLYRFSTEICTSSSPPPRRSFLPSNSKFFKSFDTLSWFRKNSLFFLILLRWTLIYNGFLVLNAVLNTFETQQLQKSNLSSTHKIILCECAIHIAVQLLSEPRTLWWAMLLVQRTVCMYILCTTTITSVYSKQFFMMLSFGSQLSSFCLQFHIAVLSRLTHTWQNISRSPP